MDSPLRHVRILDASVSFSDQPLRKPLQLSSGLISEVTLASAEVRVRVGDKEARGLGSIYLSDLWAWPEPALTHEQRDEALRGYTEKLAGKFAGHCGGESESPLELGLRLHHTASEDTPASGDVGVSSPIPILARAMCASPFDAALHDAVGQALGISAFDFYAEPYPIPSADSFFGDGACAAISRVIQAPQESLDAWWIVGANDDLEKDVAPYVRQRGYRCFKLKLLGRDTEQDVQRTVEVFRKVREFGCANPRLSVDSNEANPDADSVLEYLQRLRDVDTEVFGALKYLEQPTGRDILQHAYDWRAVTELKPVFLDEGLTSLELLQTAKDQGWSGLALKTCKGHSFALVAAAWALENGFSLTLQDLTNPGLSAIHAALFASRIPMKNGVELNSPQYTPAANEPWLPRLSGLLEVAHGVHRVPQPAPVGLGAAL